MQTTEEYIDSLAEKFVRTYVFDSDRHKTLEQALSVSDAERDIIVKEVCDFLQVSSPPRKAKNLSLMNLEMVYRVNPGLKKMFTKSILVEYIKLCLQNNLYPVQFTEQNVKSLRRKKRISDMQMMKKVAKTNSALSTMNVATRVTKIEIPDPRKYIGENQFAEGKKPSFVAKRVDDMIHEINERTYFTASFLVSRYAKLVKDDEKKLLSSLKTLHVAQQKIIDGTLLTNTDLPLIDGSEQSESLENQARIIAVAIVDTNDKLVEVQKNLTVTKDFVNRRLHALGFFRRTINGDSKLVNEKVLKKGINEMLPLIQKYAACDIANGDETSVLVSFNPRTAFSRDGKCHFKNTKKCYTLMVVCFANGDKMEPLVINRDTATVKMGCEKIAGVKYHNSATKWMTKDVFQTIVDDLQKRAEKNGRDILFIVDNATSHYIFNDTKMTKKEKDQKKSNEMSKFLSNENIYSMSPEEFVGEHNQINQKYGSTAKKFISQGWEDITSSIAGPEAAIKVYRRNRVTLCYLPRLSLPLSHDHVIAMTKC